MTNRSKLHLAAAVAVLLSSACYAPDGFSGADGAAGGGDPDVGPDENPADDGVGPALGQGGAQDFGQFRAILDGGGIPGPSTIDDVGFFAEHRIDLGAADCGYDVCLNASMGVMGNMMTGSNCTMVMMGLTTPIDIEEVPRLPLNLAIAIDTSGSMRGASIEYVRSGLERMRDVLSPQDTITLISFADDAVILADHVSGDDDALLEAIENFDATGQTNVYAGLRTAFESVQESADADHQNRVLLLSDGQSTTGLVEDARLLTLAESYVGEGIAVSTIGMGQSFNPALMRGLAEAGGGAFYFLEDLAAVEEVFVEEVEAFLLPIAHDVVIEADVAQGYALRGVFGTHRDVTLEGHTRLEIPVLQLAHRTSDTDAEGGRRGGGGAIVLELMPQEGASGSEVGTVTIAYDSPYTDERIEQTIEIDSPLEPGQTPADGFFADAGSRKAFVTLNLYAGFEMAATRAAAGDGVGARAVLDPLLEAATAWNEREDDADIEDDLRYVERFIENLEVRGVGSSDAPTAEPWPRD